VGFGVVYELSPPTQKGGKWTYTVLYNFQGEKDGLFPWATWYLISWATSLELHSLAVEKGRPATSISMATGTVFKLSSL
jgi:hypothetical protein